MKYELKAIRSCYGAVSIDYIKHGDNGEREIIKNSNNLSVEVAKEIYESIRKIESLLNNTLEKSLSPCDYCTNSQGNTCPIRACYEYSRWENNGKAPKEVIEKVNDFHCDRW